jgi:hypothetical protein
MLLLIMGSKDLKGILAQDSEYRLGSTRRQPICAAVARLCDRSWSAGALVEIISFTLMYLHDCKNWSADGQLQ